MAAPSAVPAKRWRETVKAAPREDCVITRVVTGAQYASGKRTSRAAATDTTAATAVRAECSTIGQAFQRRRMLASRLKLPFGMQTFLHLLVALVSGTSTMPKSRDTNCRSRASFYDEPFGFEWQQGRPQTLYHIWPER